MNGDGQSQALLRDTAACYRFVKATAAACKLGSGFPSYSDPTRKLLTYIKALSVSTQESLASFPSQSPDDPAEYRSRRQWLFLIREAWQSLHFYVQPAVDADTLNVPTELVRLLTERVRSVSGCGTLEFAVIHTDRLNYFQFPPGDFERTVVDLGDLVSAKSEFPSNLGIIALPHSQAQHLFLNGLLAHEVGHFVFSKLNCLDRIKGAISSALNAAFAPPADVGLDPTIRGKLPGILQDWSEELFCDLLGVHLLGPSFVLASIEFFDLANRLTVGGHIDQIAARSDFKFRSSHPARFFRLWQQTELLESLGWWGQIKNSKSHHIQIMAESLGFRQGAFSFEELPAPTGNYIVDAFFKTIESIVAEVGRVTQALRDGDGHAKEIAGYSDLKGRIDSYLRNAVVPSTLWVNEGFVTPSAIVLLNVAHLFYLTGIEELISNSENADTTDVRMRDIWMERVEGWTTKGLEDISLRQAEA